MINKKDLEEAINYFDKLIEQLVTEQPSNFDVIIFGKSYNVIKTALADYKMRIENESSI